MAGNPFRVGGHVEAADIERALDSLHARGVVVQSAEGPVIDNPFFREWIRRELLPDTPVD